MVTELATFRVRAGQEDAFYHSYLAARPHLAQFPGCESATIYRVHEAPSTFVLCAQWRTLEDHLEGFRASEAYAEWRKLLSPFFDGDPSVVHLVNP
ncbi:antibiotic biosynthesis monooxygenase family protein [Ferrimicrobium sp.]|uniref:antibiotic biosynthesis monooxygenase family protein n=1 Tax=Ferrimicrobium sp. TaxID=2926050 RepID=UPI00261F4A95|nr:antibiotic biosynthesis monooxygenase family protein [Ferrimicrobium sp.]